MRDSAVTKDAPAARETDGKQWPEDVMASMAEFARLTGKDRDRRHQAMFLIRHAITQRQQKAEVAAAEDEGITAEDVVDASRMWQATRATD